MSKKPKKRKEKRPLKVKKAKKKANFLEFIKQKQQQQEFLGLIGFYLLAAIILKLCYPIMDTFADSGTYIQWAESLRYGGYRPIGYSYYLYALSKLAPSGSASLLFWSQYLAHVIATVSFIFSIKYLFKLSSNWLYYVISGLLVINPIFLYLTNVVMADSLFNSLTLLYITTGFWILYKRNILTIALHVLLIFLLLYIRYTALIYPFISCVLFLASIRNRWKALAFSSLPFLVLFIVNQHVSIQTEKVVGYKKISAFGEWLLSNNALHVIPYIDLKPEEIQDPEVKYVHELVLSTYPDNKHLYPEKGKATFNFMWDNKSPLKQGLYRKKNELNLAYMPVWFYMGEYYKAYGVYIIKKYPLKYIQHYVWPNIKRVFLPPNGLLAGYAGNQPSDTLKKWFKQDDITFAAKFDLQKKLFAPWLKYQNFLFLLIGMASVIYFFVIFKKLAPIVQQGGIFLITFVSFYIAFIIIASPAILRTVSIAHIPILAFFAIFGNNVFNIKKKQKEVEKA